MSVLAEQYAVTSSMMDNLISTQNIKQAFATYNMLGTDYRLDETMKKSYALLTQGYDEQTE